MDSKQAEHNRNMIDKLKELVIEQNKVISEQNKQNLKLTMQVLKLSNQKNKPKHKKDIKLPFVLGDKKIRVRSDGYINATDLCKAGGKQFKHYNSLIKVKEIYQKLSTKLNIPINKLVVIVKGGNYNNQGTWVHPQIATHMAQWVNSDFVVSVSEWIEEWKTNAEENKNKYINQLQQITPEPKTDSPEYKIQQRLHKQLGGAIEVETEAGFIDLLTNTEIIEIKCSKCWKQGVGQLLIYSHTYPNHAKVLYIFDHYSDTTNTNMIINNCSKYDISVKFI